MVMITLYAGQKTNMFRNEPRMAIRNTVERKSIGPTLMISSTAEI